MEKINKDKIKTAYENGEISFKEMVRRSWGIKKGIKVEKPKNTVQLVIPEDNKETKKEPVQCRMDWVNK